MSRSKPAALLVLIVLGLLVRYGVGREGEAKLNRIKATNAGELRGSLGQEVTIYGSIDSTGKSSSGHQFLNFYGKQVSVFCAKDDVAQFKDGKPADLYKGKQIEVIGKLSLFNGKLQIKLTTPKNIKLLLETAGRSPPKTVELKQVGREAWMSPAGLRYQGHDPEGRTRVEHILRHTRDIPDRDGPHGVFDGGKGVAFAVIDEAWQIAERQKRRPNAEDERSSYLIRMSRRVGYLGGRTGKQRGHPALDRVFIVFETDTKNIVTAFPR
ncbi:MAG: hypothetical protein H8E66_01600 [Planctomycetes bacterium]|nr:hypothetical protein [Planctomycetota bacterium]